VNKIQKAIAWVLHKAIGFPPWNVQNSMPPAYSRFFSSQNAEMVMEKVAVFRNCCNILGRLLATFPIDVVESQDGISKPVDSYIAQRLKQPNEFMNQVDFFEAMALNFNSYGNAYAEIVRIGNRVTALWPLPNDRTRPKFENQVLYYEVSLPNGQTLRFEADRVLHFKDFSFDGINGISKLRMKAIEKAMHGSEFHDRFITNGSRPNLAVKFPTTPSPEEQSRLRETFERLYSGPENAGRALFLFGKEVDVMPLSISPSDAELVPLLDMSEADIAAAFGVPLQLLNRAGQMGTSSFASSEMFDLGFVKYTMRPMCVRFAVELTAKLLNPRLSQSVKFNLSALLEGDTKAQAESLRTYVAAGIMAVNEARAKLNLPRVEGGDKPFTQSNQAPIDLLGEIATKPNSSPAAGQTESANGKDNPSDVDWKATTMAINDVLWKASIR
jgi:HK97 family phage portal protein